MRFIRRDEPDHAMVSVVLRTAEGRVRGEVFLPLGEQGGAAEASAAPAGGPLAAGEALGLATAHAFDQRTDIAIVDAEGLWRPEWGTLHAPPDAAPEVEAAAAALSGAGAPEGEVADPAEAEPAEPDAGTGEAATGNGEAAGTGDTEARPEAPPAASAGEDAPPIAEDGPETGAAEDGAGADIAEAPDPSADTETAEPPR